MTQSETVILLQRYEQLEATNEKNLYELFQVRKDFETTVQKKEQVEYELDKIQKEFSDCQRVIMDLMRWKKEGIFIHQMMI